MSDECAVLIQAVDPIGEVPAGATPLKGHPDRAPAPEPEIALEPAHLAAQADGGEALVASHLPAGRVLERERRAATERIAHVEGRCVGAQFEARGRGVIVRRWRGYRQGTEAEHGDGNDGHDPLCALRSQNKAEPNRQRAFQSKNLDAPPLAGIGSRHEMQVGPRAVNAGPVAPGPVARDRMRGKGIAPTGPSKEEA